MINNVKQLLTKKKDIIYVDLRVVPKVLKLSWRVKFFDMQREILPSDFFRNSVPQLKFASYLTYASPFFPISVLQYLLGHDILSALA